MVIARDRFSHPHTNNGFFFYCSPPDFYWKNMKKASEKSWIRWDATRLHFNITMTSRIDIGPACGCSFFRFSHKLVQVWYNYLTWVKPTEIPIWCVRKIILTWMQNQYLSEPLLLADPGYQGRWRIIAKTICPAPRKQYDQDLCCLTFCR